MRNTLIKAIAEEAKTNDSIIFMTGDLGYGVVDMFSNTFPDRFYNMGIAEDNMMAMAAGMALSGKCVFVYSIGNFSTLRCLEQIRNDVCYHNANVKIISLAAGFAYGVLGVTHFATEDIACMRSLPNMTVFTPSDPLEVAAVAKAAVKIKGPCYIRIGRGGESNLRDSFQTNSFHVGEPYKLMEGNNDIAIFSIGAISVESLSACKELNSRGVYPTLYTFPTIKPLNEQFVKDCAKRYKMIITVEEHQINGGFGGVISELLSDIKGNHASLKRIGLNDVFPSKVGNDVFLRDYYNMNKDTIIRIVEDFMNNNCK